MLSRIFLISSFSFSSASSSKKTSSASFKEKPSTAISSGTRTVPLKRILPTIVLFSSMSCTMYSVPPVILNISTRAQFLDCFSSSEAECGHIVATSPEGVVGKMTRRIHACWYLSLKLIFRTYKINTYICKLTKPLRLRVHPGLTVLFLIFVLVGIKQRRPVGKREPILLVNPASTGGRS